MSTTAQRTTTTRPTRKFVVGIDGSTDAKRALRWAAHLGADYPAVTIEAVYVCDLPVVLGADWHYLLPGWEPMVTAEQVAQQTVHDAFGGHVPAQVTIKVVQGFAVAELLTAAKDAELLIVGSRGLGTFSKVLLGSVGRQCIQHAPCPVLVIHASEPPTKSEAASADAGALVAGASR
jgi:nucleotide-binding universal stress UspA family protein